MTFIPTLKTLALGTLLAGALAAVPSAQAHVVLDYQVAMAGSFYKATFKVGHGCGAGTATRQIAVQIPAGVRGAHPMPKPGWRLEIERDAAGDARRVTWTAASVDDALPDAYYDEFALQARLPTAAGPLYWPVDQVCTQGRADWTQVPADGQKLSDLKSPAAYLEVLPADGGGAGGHQH